MRDSTQRRAEGGYVGIQRCRGRKRRRAGGRDGVHKSKRGHEARRADVPLAIGSHRSCSLTSNSYPCPCACVSSAFRSMGSSSGDAAGSTRSLLGGVADMLSAGCCDGLRRVAAAEGMRWRIIRWRPRHGVDSDDAWRPRMQPSCNGGGGCDGGGRG